MFDRTWCFDPIRLAFHRDAGRGAAALRLHGAPNRRLQGARRCRRIWCHACNIHKHLHVRPASECRSIQIVYSCLYAGAGRRLSGGYSARQPAVCGRRAACHRCGAPAERRGGAVQQPHRRHVRQRRRSQRRQQHFHELARRGRWQRRGSSGRTASIECRDEHIRPAQPGQQSHGPQVTAQQLG